jgi:predicted deacylase
MLKYSKRLIDITGMRDVIQRRIPVLSLDSQVPGPAVWLAACIHGDEPGGTAIIHEVVRTIRESGMRHGSIHALPLINSMGFENVSRFINSEREDLNRCFPGDPKGSMGERIARRLFDTIARSEPDLVIDLHSDWIQSVPYVLIEPRRHFMKTGLRRKTIDAARATGLLIVQDSDSSEALSRTLTGALVEKDVCAFTLEAGGAGGIVETETVSPPTPASSQVLDYTSRPHCTSSGLVRFAVAPGDEVATGAIVARVFSAFGSIEETLRAEHSGFVLGVADHARAVPGSEVIAIAEIDNKT